MLFRLLGEDVLQIDKLRQLFIDKGFVGEIIDYTPFGGEGTVRGNEILMWVTNNRELIGCYHSDFTTYVIFDDSSDMLLWQKDNFILTDGFCGLTPSNVYEATRKLNSKD